MVSLGHTYLPVLRRLSYSLPEDWLEEMKAYVWQNFEVFWEFILENFPGAVVTEPEGSFVVWVDYGGCGMTGQELVQLLCKEGLFVGDEGEEFYGRDTCFRYCLAVPRKDLEISLSYLKQAVDKRNTATQ